MSYMAQVLNAYPICVPISVILSIPFFFSIPPPESQTILSDNDFLISWKHFFQLYDDLIDGESFVGKTIMK